MAPDAAVTAGEAGEGDVVLAPDGQVYQLLNHDSRTWGAIVPVGSFGEPWQPDGDLILLARHGRPA